MYQVNAADTALAEAARNGDAQSLNLLFSRMYPRLLAISLRLCGNTFDARDAVQEALLTAHIQLPQLKVPEHFYFWVRRILFHQCLQLKKQNKRLTDFPETGKLADTYVEDIIARCTEEADTRSKLYKTLSGLSEPILAASLLRYFSTYNSYDQIATLLGIPVGTVRSRLSEARQQLTSQWKKIPEADETEYRKAQEWSTFYLEVMKSMSQSESVRARFLQHYHPDMHLYFTSGKHSFGRKALEAGIEQDVRHGALMVDHEISSCGNLTLLEARNQNSPEHPDYCPPRTALVLIRREGKVATMHLHHSPRLEGKGSAEVRASA